MKLSMPNNAKTEAKLKKMPKLYIVAYWARWGTREYSFSGKYVKDNNGNDIPLVWDYDDHNGTDDTWYLRPLYFVTTAGILLWTHNKGSAELVAKSLNLVRDLAEK